jgi:hypothetical protein
MKNSNNDLPSLKFNNEPDETVLEHYLDKLVKFIARFFSISENGGFNDTAAKNTTGKRQLKNLPSHRSIR